MRLQGLLVVLVAGLAIVAPSLCEAQFVWTPETGRFINMKRLPKETAELQVEYARTLLVQGNPKGALSETTKFSEFYADSEYADENQFLRGEIRLSQGSHMDAAKEFQQVIANYPDSELFNQVIDRQYEVGDTLFRIGEEKAADSDKRKWYKLGLKISLFGNRPFKRAIDVFEMVIENEPFTDAAAQAQYKIGLSHFAREEYIEAAFEYRSVIEDYPDSSWVDDASFGLAQTYRRASLEPFYDQAPSELAIDATEEFFARYPGDERGEELAGLKEEMREKIAEQRMLSARFYEKRRMENSARIYYEVVAEEFSNTYAALEAKRWLEENPAPDRASSAFFRPAY